VTLRDDFEELNRAWADLKRAILGDRELHVYLAVTYLTVLGVVLVLTFA
jgi:hypothetical protein